MKVFFSAAIMFGGKRGAGYTPRPSMATQSLCLVTPRDIDLFQALDRCPLTVRQLLKLSATFVYPFTTERRVQERLHRLCAAGRVRRWLYATAGRGALSYYTLSLRGFQVLHESVAR